MSKTTSACSGKKHDSHDSAPSVPWKRWGWLIPFAAIFGHYSGSCKTEAEMRPSSNTVAHPPVVSPPALDPAPPPGPAPPSTRPLPQLGPSCPCKAQQISNRSAGAKGQRRHGQR